MKTSAREKAPEKPRAHVTESLFVRYRMSLRGSACAYYSNDYPDICVRKLSISGKDFRISNVQQESLRVISRNEDVTTSIGNIFRAYLIFEIQLMMRNLWIFNFISEYFERIKSFRRREIFASSIEWSLVSRIFAIPLLFGKWHIDTVLFRKHNMCYKKCELYFYCYSDTREKQDRCVNRLGSRERRVATGEPPADSQAGCTDIVVVNRG